MINENIPEKGLISDIDIKDIDIRPDMSDRISHVMVSPTYLHDKVSEIACEITKDAERKDLKELDMVVVLKGAATFANDLAREIFKKGGPAINFSYISASSYGKNTDSSGDVKIEGSLPSLKNKDVLIVEDIVDTGLTMYKLQDYLLEGQKASSVNVCTLLDKKSKRIPELVGRLRLNYVGFEVPDVFVAGYGMDCAEQFRELPYIVAVKKGE